MIKIKKIVMDDKPKIFDLEDRTLKFARNIREFTKILPKTLITIEDCKQLIRSSGSVGANYIEANEALSKKDFVMRIKIARKESKESCYWLKLLETSENNFLNITKEQLVQEATELMNIFGAIIRNSK